MKLADALRGMSGRSLGSYRDAVDAPITGTAELVARLAEPGRVRRVVEALSPDALLALRIVWYGGHAPLPTWSFRQIFDRQSPGHGAEKPVEDLVRAGLLLPPLAFGGQYGIPDEMRPTLEELQVGPWLQEAGFWVPAAQEPAAPRSAGDQRAPLVVAEFARFLGAMATEARVTQQGGVVYQSDQRRLAGVTEAAADAALPPAAYAPDLWAGYDLRVGRLAAMAMSLDLLAGVKHAWVATPTAGEWVQQGVGAQWEALLSVWARLCRQALQEPAIDTLWPLLYRPGPWRRPLRLARWLAQFQRVRPEILEGGVVNLVLREGVRLGALEWAPASDDAADAAYRPAAALRLHPRPTVGQDAVPPMAEPLITQGTFEVLAGPRTAPAAFRLLEAWAERVSIDRIATYRLTRRSVAAAVRRGERPADLLAALEAGTGGLPQNVGFSLRGWTSSIPRFEAEVALVLRAPDAEGAARAASALRQCLPLGDGIWQVPAAQIGPVWQALAAAGCDVAGDIQQLREQLRRPQDSGDGTLAEVGLPWPGHVRPDRL